MDREVSGTYGSGKTPCTVFVVETYKGGAWYCVEDSKNVNYTYDEIDDGVDVEELSDVDFFTAGKGVETLDELFNQVYE
jgi:hypothetical protein